MAVYTEIEDDALINFIADYDIGEVLSCKGIAEGIENSNFIVTTTRHHITSAHHVAVARRLQPALMTVMC